MCEDFIDVYNQELATLLCAMRVAAPVAAWHSGSLVVLDETGSELGFVPNSIAPIEFAAFARLLAKRFEQGLAHGRVGSSYGQALQAAECPPSNKTASFTQSSIGAVLPFGDGLPRDRM
jgi:hypothetical protein